MTLKEAQARVRALGIVIKRTEYDEYKVNYKKGKEATAYYATDLKDAVDTAEAMAKRKGNPAPQERRRIAALKKARARWGKLNAQHDRLGTLMQKTEGKKESAI